MLTMSIKVYQNARRYEALAFDINPREFAMLSSYKRMKEWKQVKERIVTYLRISRILCVIKSESKYQKTIIIIYARSYFNDLQENRGDFLIDVYVLRPYTRIICVARIAVI